MYRTVIVPLDGSAFGEQVLPTAATLASRSGASLELVRVHQAYPFELGYSTHWNELLRRDENAYLEAMSARVGRELGIRAETLLLDGVAVDAICACASRAEAPLIVMSTHGRTGFSRMWLGSVADGVMRHSDQPVLMIRPPEENGAAAAAATLRTMLVPLDGSALAEQVLPYAIALAEAMRTAVQVVRVVQPVHPLPAYPIPNVPVAELPQESLDTLVQRAEGYVTSLASRLGRDVPALSLTTDVRVAESPARAILALAQDVDVVALATHGRGVTRMVLGSVADKVIRGGPRATLVVRAHHD